MKLRERSCRDCGRIWSDEIQHGETSNITGEKTTPCPMCASKNVDSSPIKYVDEEEPKDWFFTFGCGQENAGKYTVIHGTFESARQKMVERYGLVWAFQYPSAEAAGVEEWGLTCLS